jgi:DivIVA domain-containing protein
VTGQRGAAADAAAIPGQRRPEPERPHFDKVLRGYDRIEVDEYIEQLLAQNAELRQELASSAAARPASAPEPAVREEQSPQHYDVDTPAEDSFGFRAEKLLRLAEREAAEMRTRATRDAEGVEATARRRAEEQLRAAEREAEEIRAQAAAEAGRLKKLATVEASRVSHLHRTTKDELRRLAGLLNQELARPDPEATTTTTPAGDAVATESPANTESPGTVASNP